MKKPVKTAVIAVVTVALAAPSVIGLVALASANSRLKSDNAALGRDNDGLKSQLAGLNTQLADGAAQIQSLQTELNDSNSALNSADAAMAKLKRQYNALFDTEQKLYTLVSIYANTPTYVPTYNPIHCTSNSIGSYVYTSCY